MMGTLVSVASITASTPVADVIKSDIELFELEARLIEATDREVAAGDELDKVSEPFLEWHRRNPQPEMRKCCIGTASELWAWQHNRTLPDPNADLKAAMAEHGAAMKEWKARRDAAHQEVDKADEKLNAVQDECYEIRAQMMETPARTFEGLIAKARSAILHEDGDLAWSVLDDLVEIMKREKRAA